MQRRGRWLFLPAPNRLTPGPLFGRPTHAGDRETGSWTPAATPGLSVNRPALGQHHDGAVRAAWSSFHVPVRFGPGRTRIFKPTYLSVRPEPVEACSEFIELDALLSPTETLLPSLHASSLPSFSCSSLLSGAHTPRPLPGLYMPRYTPRLPDAYRRYTQATPLLGVPRLAFRGSRYAQCNRSRLHSEEYRPRNS